MIETYNKITTGFVIQRFERKGKEFVCVEQNFTAGDIIDREDERGEPVDVDVREEIYQPFEMLQPGRDYYFLHIWGCVEPTLYGPYPTAENRDIEREKHEQEKGTTEDLYLVFDVDRGVKVEF